MNEEQEEEKKQKRLDKWGWTLLAIVVGVALFLVLDIIGCAELIWH